MIKLTIITICYNDREGLRRTLESVKRQTVRDFQYVVIDGGSKDGSAELLDEYADVIDYGVSEPDGGIYNAMNKGISHAEGDYCLFLNGGDYLYSYDTIERVLPLLGSADFMTGDTESIHDDGSVSLWPSVNKVTVYLMAMYSLSHQATFIRTALLKARPYREDLRIVSDWEQMFYELIIRDRTYCRLPLKICCFTPGGVSGTEDVRKAERKKVLSEHFSERMQQDIAHPNVLVRIATLADEGTGYYRFVRFFARMGRKLYRYKLRGTRY